MTKPDYELIAKLISGLNLSWQVKKEIAEVFAVAFATQRPQFNPEKFKAACLGW